MEAQRFELNSNIPTKTESELFIYRELNLIEEQFFGWFSTFDENLQFSIKKSLMLTTFEAEWNIENFYSIFINFLHTEIHDALIEAEIQEYLFLQSFADWVVTVEFFEFIFNFGIQPSNEIIASIVENFDEIKELGEISTESLLSVGVEYEIEDNIKGQII